MKGKMGIRRKQSKFIFMEAQLIIKAVSLKTPLVRLEWMRDAITQAKLVARGASKNMNSKHLEGLASDFCFLDDLEDDGTINWKPDKYKELGEFWESLGGEWGGRYGAKDNKLGWDSGHFCYKDI